MEVKFKNFVLGIQNLTKDLKQNEDFLSTLDQNIGDGDHGVNMVRGFVEVEKIAWENQNLNDYLNLIGRTLLAKIGGASGPLYGMSFINTANNLKEHSEFMFNEFKILVDSFCKTLETLGRVQLKEKTMYDVWKPLQLRLQNSDSLDKSSLINFVLECANSTKNLLATKGRASYLKERSIGTIDPGSYSSYLILKNLIEIL
ncbi:dihydroxyacetone kinase DhaL subunit [Mycoplasmopsis mustelae]|uniref:Dihydroxyacetone kinase DhaL subunit n=1 Tax=Mycoplasmopsis mustelae TaxID=171289 RepID=A0A4R7UD45_9BACT|nr:dihydroxyacetone kinase subunit DhaL [Mycoplasmopsis mustelae]TDV24388.1 dihydroxyacetone kinase DhaL subunit [Mycoplasmopsis mustelae]